MVAFGRWIDAHAHLADPRWEGEQDRIIEEAQARGIHFFMQGGVDPADWERQRALKSRHPHAIGLCFGLHPYFVAANEDEACEAALDLLAPQLVETLGIGEMGLDFRPHIMKDSQERQIHVFEQQIELAHTCQKPMVLHLVQAHETALRVLDLWGIPKSKGLVHSFNSSAAKVEDFINRGLYLSVGGPVCRPDNQKLRQAVKEIPLEYLLVESDSPDQPPPRYKGENNPPESIWEVARTIAEIKGLDPMEILDITTQNFVRLFGGTAGRV
jgi:TatD DNase family protein